MNYPEIVEKIESKREAISFEEAKGQAIKKWESIVRRIKRLENDIQKACGFCNRTDQLSGGSEERDCVNLCEAYKICDVEDVADYLASAKEEAEDILTKLENLTEE